MRAMPIRRRCSRAPAAPKSLREAQREFMRRVFEDALRFAGVAIVRAILGRHHAPDLEQIEDPARRAPCERNALLLARELIKDAQYVSDLGEVMKVARELRTVGSFSP